MSTLEILQDMLVSDYKIARAGLRPDAALSSLGIDSLGLLELMFKIEDRFHVKIPGDPPTGLETVDDVVRYIDELIAKHAGPRGPAAAGARSDV